eukprot:550218_1
MKKKMTTLQLTSTSDDIMKSHNENKQRIYKYFGDAWNALRLLLKYFDKDDEQKDNTNRTEIMKKETVKQVMSQIPSLREQSIQHIMNNITAYVKEYGNSPDPFEIIKMCDACAVVESFPTGKQIVVENITNNLLKYIKDKFAGCEYIKQRFEDYYKVVTHYDKVYSFFIPVRWIVPVTFSLQFCKLTRDQIEQQLKENLEIPHIVIQAKQICIENENKLQKEAEEFLCQQHAEFSKYEIEQMLPNYVGMISTIFDQYESELLLVKQYNQKIFGAEFIYKRAHQNQFSDGSNIGIVMSEYGCWNHESTGFIFSGSSNSSNLFYILTEGDVVIKWK